MQRCCLHSERLRSLQSTTTTSSTTTTTKTTTTAAAITTSQHLRRRSMNSDPLVSQFEDASLRLHLNAVPDRLPCRQNEFHNIFTFLKNAISGDGVGNGMYVCGMPGTGKTATVLEVVRKLQSMQSSNGYVGVVVVVTAAAAAAAAASAAAIVVVVACCC